MEESKEPLNKSKEGDGENLDAIKKFIEDQEKEYIQQETKKDNNAPLVKPEKPTEMDGCKDFDERLAVASSMMDMILIESEERIAKKKDCSTSKQTSPKG